MEIRIAGWRSRGLRCPDVDLTLTGKPGESGTVSVIQMPNGTGKTSTLRLLGAALSGDARNWSADQVREFRGFSDATEGMFRVDLLVDGKELVFELVLDFETGTAHYSTTSPLIGGRRDGWEPPRDARRFLHKDFVDLIVFDGEFASDVLDSEKSSAERAVDAMSQLYLVDRARNLAESERDRLINESGATSANPKALQRQRNELEKYNVQIRRVTALREKIADQIDKNKGELQSLDSEFDSELRKSAGNTEQLDAIKERIAQAESQRSALVRDLMDSVRVPSRLSTYFASNLDSLRDGLASVQLPPSTTKQFFRELAEQDACVCGRPIDADIRQTILDHSYRYLGREEAGVLNAIKAQIEGRDANGGTGHVSDIVQELQSAQDALYEANTDLDEFEETVSSPDDRLNSIRERIEELTIKIEKDQMVLDEIDRPAEIGESVESTSLAGLQQKRKEIQRKIEQLTDNVEVGERTRIVLELLSRTKAYARQRLRSQLTELANRRLAEVLRQSPVSIESIGSYVRLKGQSDASVGQKLAVGYVIMANLLQRGAHSLPFVVDSPANPIDHTVRRQIAQLIPEVCDQFVAFVISSEKHAFTSVLGSAASKCQFLTVFRKVDGTHSYMSDLPSRGVTESDRFVLVEDKDFFESFDMDEEA